MLAKRHRQERADARHWKRTCPAAWWSVLLLIDARERDRVALALLSTLRPRVAAQSESKEN